MTNHRLDLEAELHISPRLVAGLLALLATATMLLSEVISDTIQFQVQSTALLALALCIVAWALSGWKSWLGKWFTVVSPVVIIALTYRWTGTPGTLALAAIPVGLAFVLMTPAAAIAVALSTTGLLLVTPRYLGASTGEVVIASAAVWSTLGLIYAVHRPMYQYAQSAWTYYSQAQALLEEARDRRADLNQALSDFAHANRQIALANEKMAAMRLVAEEAQKTKAAFVAKVSHEFRTPLNMIIGLTDLLVETPEVYGEQLSPALLEDLKIVHRNCKHLSSMVNDVLDLSQAEAGRLTLHREMVRLAEVIEGALAVVHPLLEKKGLDLRVQVPHDLPDVHCDRTRIRQVILNLVSNAARFTEQGGITVSAREQNGYVVVSVSDTGPGISEKDAERIFEPFCQAAGSPWRETGGSGLGLSISKQFVELHGGRIWLESEVGIGTTFHFDLPVSQLIEPIARPERWIKEDWTWLQRTSRLKLPDEHYKPRIILCDETGSLHQGFRRYAEDAEFIETSSPIQVAQALRECPAHAVVFNSSSVDTTWALVEEASAMAPDTPIIGCSVPPHLERALDAGARGYLVKPVTRSDLERVFHQFDSPIQRVLVVDDSPDVLQLFTRMVYSLDQTIEVSTASNGEQALEQLHRNPPDLLLLDIVMPQVDGWQVLALKNRDERCRDVPVIFLSAQDPAEQPLETRALLTTMGHGLPLSKMLYCMLAFSSLMLGSD